VENTGKFLLDVGKYVLTSVVIAGIFGGVLDTSLFLTAAVVAGVFVVVGVVFSSLRTGGKT